VDDTNREAILARILRFGLTTADDVQRHVSPNVSLNAVRKMLAKLVETGWLNAYPLPEREKYYVAGKAAVLEYALDPRKSSAFGPLALPTRIGILLYCSRYPVSKPSPEEFKQQFTDLCRPGLSVTNYVYELGERFRIGWLIVDHGAEPKKVLSKVRNIVRERKQIPAFKAAILKEEFSVTVIAPTEGRCEHLRRIYLRQPLSLINVQFVMIPELLPLLVTEA
jgi:hypothetical protein